MLGPCWHLTPPGSTHLVPEAVQRHRRPPLQVPCDAARPQPIADPGARDVARVGRPVPRSPALLQPRLQPLLQLRAARRNEQSMGGGSMEGGGGVTPTLGRSRKRCRVGRTTGLPLHSLQRGACHQSTVQTLPRATAGCGQSWRALLPFSSPSSLLRLPFGSLSSPLPFIPPSTPHSSSLRLPFIPPLAHVPLPFIPPSTPHSSSLHPSLSSPFLFPLAPLHILFPSSLLQLPIPFPFSSPSSLLRLPFLFPLAPLQLPLPFGSPSFSSPFLSPSAPLHPSFNSSFLFPSAPLHPSFSLRSHSLHPSFSSPFLFPLAPLHHPSLHPSFSSPFFFPSSSPHPSFNSSFLFPLAPLPLPFIPPSSPLPLTFSSTALMSLPHLSH